MALYLVTISLILHFWILHSTFVNTFVICFCVCLDIFDSSIGDPTISVQLAPMKGHVLCEWTHWLFALLVNIPLVMSVTLGKNKNN